MFPRVPALALALAAILLPARAAEDDFRSFDTRGLPGSQGISIRLAHPAAWRKVRAEDEAALAELRGPHGGVTGIVQVGRGQRRADIAELCRPERAHTMLQSAADPDLNVLEVVAREHEGRPGYEIRYERTTAPGFLRVRSLVVCLKDTRVVVSCGAAGAPKSALAAIEPVCDRVMESVRITEE